MIALNFLSKLLFCLPAEFQISFSGYLNVPSEYATIAKHGNPIITSMGMLPICPLITSMLGSLLYFFALPGIKETYKWSYCREVQCANAFP